jgi:NADPH-dependent curcumin reductase
MNTQVTVLHRAKGVPTSGNFAIVSSAMPDCPAEGIVVQVLFAAVDPGMRGWLSAEQNYMTVADGEVMRALGVGRVISSDCDDWRSGDVLVGWFGWQQYAAVDGGSILWRANLDLAPAEDWLGVFGLNGLTAWIGFKHFGKPKAGETVLVSTAAGGVGGTVGQLARATGLRAIGLTSNAEKIDLATRTFGYTTALDYRAEADLSAAIAAECPHGVDIFFDNVGGAIADSVFPNLNSRARVIQCGTASVASWIPVPTGPRRERDLLVKSLSWHGFVVFDHSHLFEEAMAELTTLWLEKRLVSHTHVLEGLEEAPGAIERLYRGENNGRLVLRIA